MAVAAKKVIRILRADIAREDDPSSGAIASDSAGAIYGLHSVAADIQDDEHNTTRFLVMAREPIELECRTERMITSFVFIVRNVPAALYKAQRRNRVVSRESSPE